VEEEFLLGLCHALLGSHWSQMVRRLPGRCENSIKNFWNATLRSKPASKKRGLLWAYMQVGGVRGWGGGARVCSGIACRCVMI
jgi:hypothetical protein